MAPRAQREAANVLHHDHPFHKDGELLLDGLPGYLSMRDHLHCSSPQVIVNTCCNKLQFFIGADPG